jgi:hypothetical protein
VTAVRAIVAEIPARARLAWAGGERRERALVGVGFIAAVALAGAFLFGAWHVIFGGLVRGNWRAGGFGVVLAAVAGILLRIEAAVVRRLLPRADHRA